MTQVDLQRRREVWGALSELFLDTEIDVADIARRLRSSGFKAADIQHILNSEVAPVLGGVAGHS